MSGDWLNAFASEVRRLAGASSTTETTYYPAIRALLTALLAELHLPFDVRTGTSERRTSGGTDLPDLALYDGSGTVVVLCGEVKLPSDEIKDMAVSTAQNDQVGRYLARTRAVLLCNVRGFGLVTVDPKWGGTGPVPPAARRLEQEVELWASTSAMKQGKAVPAEAVQTLVSLVDTAATRYASITEPESLALILARQARQAKTELPEKFSQAVLSRVEAERFFARFRPAEVTERKPDSGDSTAITYFYEPFLEAFDPELRKSLGVWYTPTEIVRYQAARVDELLRTELGCTRGLADDKVVVLDPCCGTGAYLLEVVRLIAVQLQGEGVGALLGAKLLDILCTRIIGFEILTAPFVVAQLQVYLALAELGVAPKESQRPAIFLTNALTGWEGTDQLKLNFPELQQEHDAVQGVKKEAKIIVILGNPPYNRFAGVPMAEEADLVDHYKGIKRDAKGRQVGNSELYTRWGIRKHLLDDLYIRFFRLAERRIGEKAEYGIVSYISNSSFLSGRSHPLMRESLLGRFHKVWVDNLHGNRLASERTPWGDSCETIFNVEGGGPGIKVGTAVTTLVKVRKGGTAPGRAKVFVRDFWGNARKKRLVLLDSVQVASTPKSKRKEKTAERPEGPREYELIQTTAHNGWKLAQRGTAEGFEEWPGLDELFPVSHQGVNPNRGLDGSLIDTDPKILEKRMRAYYSNERWAEFEREHPVLCEPRADYEPKATRDSLRKTRMFRTENVVSYLLFPLDLRWMYYEEEGNLLNRRRPELWDNLDDNEFLIAVPQPRRVSESRPLLATCLFDLHLHDRGSVGFPAMARRTDGPLWKAEPEANIDDKAWKVLSTLWKIAGDRRGAGAKGLMKRLFRVSLAITHSPQYQTDHQDSLAQDWVHVPIPRDKGVFDEINTLGDHVATLLNPLADADATMKQVLGTATKHLGVVARVDGSPIREEHLAVTYSYYGSAQGVWRPRPAAAGEAWFAGWGGTTGDLYLSEQVCVRHIPERVWQFELGGYPVLKKWLGYRDSGRRRGGRLRLSEIEHFRGMVQRVAALLALEEALNGAYEKATAGSLTAGDLGLR